MAQIVCFRGGTFFASVTILPTLSVDATPTLPETQGEMLVFFCFFGCAGGRMSRRWYLNTGGPLSAVASLVPVRFFYSACGFLSELSLKTRRKCPRFFTEACDHFGAFRDIFRLGGYPRDLPGHPGHPLRSPGRFFCDFGVPPGSISDVLGAPWAPFGATFATQGPPKV